MSHYQLKYVAELLN